MHHRGAPLERIFTGASDSPSTTLLRSVVPLPRFAGADASLHSR